MPTNIEAIRHIVATIFAAQNALKTLAPEFNRTGLGNLPGDYGWFTSCWAMKDDCPPPSIRTGFFNVPSPLP